MKTMTLMCVLSLLLIGCVNQAPTPPRPEAPRGSPPLASSGRYEILYGTTAEGVGAAQALFSDGDFVYVLGDLHQNEGGASGPGIIKEFFYSTNDDGQRSLFPSGRQVILTEQGQDIAPHPTGLTWHPNFGYWLGNTSDQLGTLFHIDFQRALSQGTLDGCVLRTVQDDAAVSGTRPMFLTLPGGRVGLATSDYGDQANAIRLYDPVALLTATKTSDENVLFSESACGPFVQSLAWRGVPGELWLIQNQSAGLGYRISEVRLNAAGEVQAELPISFQKPEGELEAMLLGAPDRMGRTPFLMINAGTGTNVHIGRLVPTEQHQSPLLRPFRR